MSRSYMGQDGESIRVTQEHLDTAVRIKDELQKASPSLRCSWAKHKRMMEVEGYTDSSSSENYRQMIKAEQKAKGVLPNAEKHVDLMSSNKLEAIRQEIGEISLAKREAQHNFRELNKLKRELSDNIVFYEEVTRGINEASFDSKFRELEPLEDRDRTMIVNMTDWHIGLKTEEFDYEVAKERVFKYVSEVVNYAKIFNISTVHVLGGGDLLNGSYMRPNQLAENEFSFSEQVVKATEIVFSFLQDLSTELNVVYRGSIIGNHSRMASGAVSNSIEGDSAENIVDAVIQRFITMSGNKRISVLDAKEGNSSMSFRLMNKNFKVVHGDYVAKKATDKLQKFISSDGVFYDVLIYGHFHHTSYVEENDGRMALGAGCLQGATDYGKKLGYDTLPSQTIVVLDGKNVTPIRVGLM